MVIIINIFLQEDEKADKSLLIEITDEELKSLNCPTYEEQEKEWEKIEKQLTTDKIKILLESINYEYIQMNFFKNTLGVINKIYIIEVKEKKISFNKKELILRINNPHLFWKKRRNQNEVSIMKYIKQNTIIPVPEILSYSNDPLKSILGCEYILMEKVPGIILSNIIDKINADELSDNIINQMISYYKILREIKTEKMDKNKIGCFKKDLEITDLIFDGPIVKISNNYLEYIVQQLNFAIEESKKIRKFKILGEKLENLKNKLIEVVNSNPLVNNLNFNDEMTVIHGDLNSTNILIDPNTNLVTGILDWEFASHNFDSIEYHFIESWFDKEEDKEKITNKMQSIINGMDWYKKPYGFEIRKYFNNLAAEANQMGFYVSSWFNKDWKDKNLAVRAYLNSEFNITMELLKDSDKYLNLIKNFKY